MDEALANLAFDLVGNLVWGAIVGSRKRPNIVPETEATNHIGKWMTVEGIVSKWSVTENGKTLLNFGGSAWIPAGARVTNSSVPRGIEGKRVKITGLVRMYKGKPEVPIYGQEQIRIE